ncbi:MAG: hypothetical protein D6E12_03730 [Desulfovibrio sp.]|nr:MAG: hypothetical protein D6E12_03730 [Desulfovibrio sp.]
MRNRLTLLPTLLILMLLAIPAQAAEEFDFAFPGLMDVLCTILQAEDIPAAMEEYGPVAQGSFEENIFLHQTWTLVLDEFTLVYDVSQEMAGEPGEVTWEDYIIEVKVENPGAAPIFHDLRQAHGWLRELGTLTLDTPDQAEFTAQPFPGEEDLAPLWWRIRVFCDPGPAYQSPCRMIRFFWSADTASHNSAWCR